jgi:hypothetical protein
MWFDQADGSMNFWYLTPGMSMSNALHFHEANDLLADNQTFSWLKGRAVPSAVVVLGGYPL